MKKAITITCIILSVGIILDSMNFAHALAMFVLAGVVPGTNLTLSADQMLGFFAGVAGFVCGRLTIRLATIATRQMARHSQPRVAAPAK